MDNQDWYRLGEQIGNLVERAIDSNDYKQLSQTLAKTIDNATEGLNKSWRAQGKALDQAVMRDKLRKEAAMRNAGTDPKTGTKSPEGTAGMVLGFAMTGVFGLGFLAMEMMKSVAPGFWGSSALFGVPIIGCLAFAAGGLVLGLTSKKKHDLANRRNQILKLMGNRDVITIDELCAGTGQKRKELLDDLHKMMQEQMFAQGAYLDELETCLMTSREAYKQYQETQGQYRARKAKEEASSQKSKEAYASYSSEIRQMLTEGQDFIQHIHECNEAIPDAQMTEKLSRLENVVTRIFNQVSHDPESAPDMHKLMTYYLPVTRKLVDAYRDLDAQQVNSQNVSSTKQEIEKSLDTINTAFENLLDSFFQSTAWDISSDISVMKTMMAQDGLVGKDFDSGEKIKTVYSDFSSASAAASAAAATMEQEQQKR